MILGDASFWVALALADHPFHASARNWFSKRSAARSIAFCRATQHSLVRLLTTEAVTRPFGLPAMSNAAAWSVYEAFLSDPCITFAAEPPNLEPTWKSFAARDIASPKLWMDAYLAAFAVVGAGELVTTDKAFKQFEGLRVTVLARA